MRALDALPTVPGPVMKIAIFGGSFNPPHVGHVLAAEYVLSTGDFDRVLVIPVFAHAFQKELVSFDHRVAMTRLAMRGLKGVEVSRVEEELGAPSRTLRTLEHLRALHPDWVCRLVVGADVLGEIGQWHASDEVVRIAPLFVLGRQGIARPDAPPAILPDVSSTVVRQLLRDRKTDAADDRDLATLVPHPVLRYVDEQDLYR